MATVDLSTAVQKLKANQVVALPTETVYGLAASIDSPEALKLIFSTKRRPFFDPLIVHVKNLEQALELAHWDPVSQFLAQTFWPGPLSLVLPKKSSVHDLISAGHSTVALRHPNHSLFCRVIEQCGHPLAAPSANGFGRISPTTAQHVNDEFANRVPVLDGGPCPQGIESTIIEVKTPPAKSQLQGAPISVIMHRPGALPWLEIEKSLREAGETPTTSTGPSPMAQGVSVATSKAPALPGCDSSQRELMGPPWRFLLEAQPENQGPKPGQMDHHYQPETPFVVCPAGPDSAEQAFRALKASPVPKHQTLPSDISQCRFEALTLPEDASLAARALYSELRKLNEKKLHFIFCPISKQKEQDSLWDGILDRLTKACHLTTGKNLQFQGFSV